MTSSAIRFIVHSDYLCPWCANAAHRWGRLEEECGDRIEVVWRSYLLRPQPKRAPRTEIEREQRREKFLRYAQSWQRPAAEEDAYPFNPWSGEYDPPGHSVPAHRAAKAAAALGADAFRLVHASLFRAYFQQGRDISSESTLAELWEEAGLPPGDFARARRPEITETINDEHRRALEIGVSGVPSVHLEGNDAVIVGAQPLKLLRRWVERLEVQAGERPLVSETAG